MSAPSRVRPVVTGMFVALFALLTAAGYTVESGDTLSEIAHEHGTTVAELVAVNGLTSADRIYVGQSLLIPSSDPGGSPTTVHIVAPGENLASIAARYGTTARALATANGITNPHVIYVGTRLFIGEAGGTFLPESSGLGTHIVASGETLSGIAVHYGTTMAKLVDLNGITDPDLIRTGTSLIVPGASWICPVPGASFFNDFGFPRSGGRFHEGTDLFAPLGTPVLAPVSGVLQQVTGSVGGKQFWLYGDDGATYIGTHMDMFGASGRVTAGAQIGTVGDSGNAAGSRPHLHFEIHPYDGAAVNPYPALASACR